jgi:hypothetical protein
MSTLRRRVRAGAVATLGIQAVVLMLGVASVCRAARHTHDDGAAPDCAMHHQPAAAAEPSTGHHHHGERENDVATSGPTLRCDCSDSASLFVGQTGVIFPAPSIQPPQTEADAISIPSVSDLELGFSPLAPPPRTYLS